MWNWASTVGIESSALRVAEFAGERAMSISSPLAYRPRQGVAAWPPGQLAFYSNLRCTRHDILQMVEPPLRLGVHASAPAGHG